MKRHLAFVFCIAVALATTHRVRGGGFDTRHQQHVEQELVQMVSSHAQLSQPRNWRPLVHWLLFIECVAMDASTAYNHQDAPIDVYLGSGARGTNELAFIQGAVGQLPKQDAQLSTAYETAVFQRFLQALFYRGVVEMPEQFRADRQLGSLWLLQQIYYNDIPHNLIRRCDAFSQHHNVRFARLLANRQDLHFQWYNPPHRVHEVVPPEKACACELLGSGYPASEVCEAMHCASQLACSLLGQQRICVHSDARSFVCTCAGHHGFAQDLSSNDA